MHDAAAIRIKLEEREIKKLFTELYGKHEVQKQVNRYKELLDKAQATFGDGGWIFISSPGRTELAGNHTDHNNGRVLAASVQLDTVACVKATGNSTVELVSEGYDAPFKVDIASLGPVMTEIGTTEALIRGVAGGLKKKGHEIGGFQGVMQSSVLQGSGLSSSASVEVLIGTIFNRLFNKGGITWVEIAKIGQYAENTFFGKPSGLMDQMACSSGGIIYIDFEDPENPKWKRLKTDFGSYGYSLAIVNTGGNHADLSADYAAIPFEMKAVAAIFDRETLQGATLAEILAKTREIRSSVSERAFLRAIHFIRETERVPKMVNALKEREISKFLKFVNKSGNSSWKYLQNLYSPHNPTEQDITLALSLSAIFLGKKGVARIHGGGFAGTIQAYVPNSCFNEYADFMEQVFGKNSVTQIMIRPYGAMQVL